ncbi:MAG: NADH-quinone oxidoreductase subunit A [Bacteroidota bacterium]
MSTSIDYISIFIQFLVAAGFVFIVIVSTHLLGPNRKTKAKLSSFECGIESKGNARVPLSIRYFLTAILFVMFDVEVIFMYPWAVNFKTIPNAFFEMFLFIGALLIGFIYIIKKGALKWES